MKANSSTAEGVQEGLKSLSEGGTPPRFLIIDDGWQQIGNEAKDSNCVVQEGAQFHLYEENKDTHEALGLIGKMLGIQDMSQEPPTQELVAKDLHGTVVGINNIDCIRWPGSEWRCLTVQWDAPSKKIVRPQRISHWNIEPEEVKKKCSSILTDRKRERPLDPSTPGFTILVSEETDDEGAEEKMKLVPFGRNIVLEIEKDAPSSAWERD
ncbi:putative galactinol--sucrose galactosyltransferase 2 [Camellia lanceoleosa]|uniref:Galactinol--sucrose galactosyltransferase 2 n=1 Tax=Camellia lanceoleosa TaxID=1840588 RepID=A0ACC0IVJ8_9ERIC|nr:putative galactinol--sucrose galactosyltransferase 2 [Camellia lanceoleosa]